MSDLADLLVSLCRSLFNSTLFIVCNPIGYTLARTNTLYIVNDCDTIVSNKNDVYNSKLSSLAERNYKNKGFRVLDTQSAFVGAVSCE